MSHSFTDINLSKLEKEWLLQPKLYDKYSKRLADAKLDLSEVEASLEVVEAEVKQRIRKNPGKYGLSKATDTAVKEAMIMTEKYQEAVKAVNLKKHDVDVLSGVINTLEHRKRTLESLVTLYGQNYFSKPKVSSQANEKVRSELDTERSRRAFTRKRKK